MNPPALAVLSARRSTLRISLKANIEREEETDAWRLLRGIVNRRRCVDRFRVAIRVLIHRPVHKPGLTLVAAVILVGIVILVASILPAAVLRCPGTILVVLAKRRCYGHTAHSLGVFNSALMNDAVYKFKRYEDASLNYTGINKHEGEDIGLYDTVLSAGDVKTFENVSGSA